MWQQQSVTEERKKPHWDSQWVLQSWKDVNVKSQVWLTGSWKPWNVISSFTRAESRRRTQSSDRRCRTLTITFPSLPPPLPLLFPPISSTQTLWKPLHPPVDGHSFFFFHHSSSFSVPCFCCCFCSANGHISSIQCIRVFDSLITSEQQRRFCFPSRRCACFFFSRRLFLEP